MTDSKGQVAPEICAFLRRPGILGPQGAEEEIQTHAGHVFLAGDFAWKLKKDVAFPFLDFSSVERRRQALAKELELNRPHASDLYLGLSAITIDDDGGWSLDGNGRFLEPILKMRRFDQACLLDRMAEAGELKPRHIEDLARTVRRIHREAPVAENFDPVGEFEAVVEGNLESLTEYAELFSEARRAQLEEATRARMVVMPELLRAQEARKAVRRCHGDLHLGNIVLWEGAPLPFDALEFDEALATSDVLYDLAFLLMDLLHRDLRPLAHLLLCDYLVEGPPEELESLVALPLYLSVRACVRAKVEAARASAMERGPKRDAAERSARSYLELAVELLEPAPVRLVAVGGLSGSGKSTVAKQLARRLPGPCGALVLRSDQERRALAGKPVGEALPPEWYRASRNEAVYERLQAKARAALRARTSVVVDAVHGHPEERAIIERIAAEAQVPFDGFWLEAPTEVLIERVTEREGDASDADAAVVRKQLEKDVGEVHWERLRSESDPGTLTTRMEAELNTAP